MCLSEKKRVQLAGRIREMLVQHVRHAKRETGRQLLWLVEASSLLVKAHRQIAKAELFQLHAASEKVHCRLGPLLQDFLIRTTELQRCRSQIEQTQVPTLRSIRDELAQLENEFDAIRYHREGDLLAAETRPIELQGVYLGPFEIQLKLDGLQEMRHGNFFRVVALDPHPASNNPAVTHPHVSDEQLCAGDALTAIHSALTNGRICDFFLLVRSVLETYNPNSPYVELGDWHGTACSDCGYVVDTDDAHYCSTCERDYCSDCISLCEWCNESTCLGCLEECPVCQERFCSVCLVTCPDCGDRICRGCLEDAKCPCHEQEEDTDETEDLESQHQYDTP